MANNKGQSLVMLVILLPTLAMLFLLTLQTLKFLVFKEESLAICRKGLLTYQQVHLKGMQQLYQLNPQAQSLRIQRTVAEANYRMAKTSKNPKWIAAARLHLEQVKKQQKVFGQWQITIWHNTQQAAFVYLQRLKSQMQSLHFIKSPVEVYGTSVPALKRKPRVSPSPNYVLRKNFEKIQNMQMLWKLRFLYSRWPIDIHCSSTISTQEETWKAVLSRVDKL